MTRRLLPLFLFAGLAQAEPRYAVRLADAPSVPPTPAPKEGRPPRVLPLQSFLLLDSVSVGATQASMVIVQVGPKSKLALHRHPSSAEILFVLEGTGRLLGTAPAHTTKLEPGSAVWVPAGKAHSIDVQSPQKPLRLLQVFVPPGPEAVLRDRSQSQGTQVLRGRVAPEALGHKTARETEVPALSIPGGKVRILFEKGSGEPVASLEVLELAAGAQVPQHQHDGSAELLYVVSGAGTLNVGGTKVPFGAETALHLPANTPHAATITQPVRAIQLYVPPGPEQRFRQAPR